MGDGVIVEQDEHLFTHVSRPSIDARSETEVGTSDHNFESSSSEPLGRAVAGSVVYDDEPVTRKHLALDRAARSNSKVTSSPIDDDDACARTRGRRT